jgi:NADH:ubiquinone oxidoreductase subunit 4 (subunit M)
MAHVEAPTFGSMILAGVLLKLGGLGLIRFSPFIVFSPILSYITSYLFIRLILTGLICSFQSDFKRLIAYSRVNHIIAVPLLVLSDNSLALFRALFLMLFHGLSSPSLFILVGITYQLYSSRQLSLMRGLLLVRPLLSFIMFCSFLFTLRAPPFPSFVTEVLFFAVSSDITCYAPLFFLFFALFSLVYNVNWFSSIVFGPASTYNTTFFSTYIQYATLFFIVIVSFIFLLLFFVI